MSELNPPPGHFLILYFASAATFTKRASDHLPAPLPATELFRLLETKYPGINQKVLCSCAVTVNLDYVDLVVEDSASTAVSRGGGEDQAPTALIIKDGDEVAIIPPVSSG